MGTIYLRIVRCGGTVFTMPPSRSTQRRDSPFDVVVWGSLRLHVIRHGDMVWFSFASASFDTEVLG
jgi:hypothetical protein